LRLPRVREFAGLAVKGDGVALADDMASLETGDEQSGASLRVRDLLPWFCGFAA